MSYSRYPPFISVCHSVSIVFLFIIHIFLPFVASASFLLLSKNITFVSHVYTWHQYIVDVEGKVTHCVLERI